MNTIHRSLMIFAAASLTAAAQVPANTAWVRVVHAVADAPAVDVRVNNNTAFEGLRFKDFTEYTPLPAGTYNLGVFLSGTMTRVINHEGVMLNGGTAYTFYALGRVANGSLTLMGTGDDISPAAMGMVKLRVVHAAATAPTVDVYATTPFAPLTSATLSGVPFALASDYLTVPAGVYQARVTVAGTKTVAINSGRVPLMGGTTRTVVAIDPMTANGPFEFLVLPDVN